MRLIDASFSLWGESSLFTTLLEFLGLRAEPVEPVCWQQAWSQYLENTVSFYGALDDNDKRLFEQRIVLFWQTTAIEGGVEVEVNDEDRLLVAASAIIPVWAFTSWHYFNLQVVHLLPAAFNKQFECGQPDSIITGMVGTGAMQGKMALSQPALHQGFTNSRDKRNVGIHEFVHIIDMADGACDGFPERIKHVTFLTPWLDLVGKKIKELDRKRNTINDYGATNEADFFAVASEYFFERPKLLHRKHPQLFAALEDVYQQDTFAIAKDIKPHKKAPCYCGSGKRYKHCCMPKD